MRCAIAALVALGLFASPALASSSQDTMKACAAEWKSKSAADQAKTTYHDFSKSCLHAGGPAAAGTYGGMGSAPAGATAQCNDGSYYKGKGHSGACSHHGGVKNWL